MRIIASSVRPPAYPAVAPYAVPMSSDTSVEMRPTMSEMRPPSRTRASRSRPATSVPIGCVQEKEPSGAVNGRHRADERPIGRNVVVGVSGCALDDRWAGDRRDDDDTTSTMPTCARWFRRSRRHASFQSDVPATGSATDTGGAAGRATGQ